MKIMNQMPPEFKNSHVGEAEDINNVPSMFDAYGLLKSD